MSSDLPRLVVEGFTVEGNAFRPSDWIERLIDTLSSYGADRRTSLRPHPGHDRRCRQISFLQVQMIAGRKCLVVDARLREANPAAFRFLQEFILSNRLRVRETDTASSTTVLSPQRG